MVSSQYSTTGGDVQGCTSSQMNHTIAQQNPSIKLVTNVRGQSKITNQPLRCNQYKRVGHEREANQYPHLRPSRGKKNGENGFLRSAPTGGERECFNEKHFSASAAGNKIISSESKQFPSVSHRMKSLLMHYYIKY